MAIQGADKIFFEQMLDFIDEHKPDVTFATISGDTYCLHTIRDLLKYAKKEEELWYNLLLDNDAVFMRLSAVMEQRLMA